MLRPGRVCRLLVFFLGALYSCVPPANAATPAQTAPAITRSFDAFWPAARGKPFAEQEALWNRLIEGPREDLYRAVVWEVRDNPRWHENKDVMLKARFAQYPRIAAQVPGEAEVIEAQLRTQALRFRALFPGAAAVPRAMIVLAPNFDAKSGVLPDGTPVLALAADSLALEKADLGVVLPHELFHLYDAEHAGVKNDGVMADTALTLPLFAEGLATYVSTLASPGYSDGQYLFLQSDMGRLPRSQLPAAARDFLRVAGTPTIGPAGRGISRSYEQWFEGSNELLNPGYPNRAGYWLGLNLIRQLRRTYSLRQLASWSPAEAQERTRAALAQMAGGSVRGRSPAANGPVPADIPAPANIPAPPPG